MCGQSLAARLRSSDTIFRISFRSDVTRPTVPSCCGSASGPERRMEHSRKVDIAGTPLRSLTKLTAPAGSSVGAFQVRPHNLDLTGNPSQNVRLLYNQVRSEASSRRGGWRQLPDGFNQRLRCSSSLISLHCSLI